MCISVCFDSHVFFFKQKTAYEMRISDWSSDVCSSDLPDHDLAFLCNSGHEYENLGAEEALKAAAPKPAETHFWLHLGASLAGRDWHAGVFGLAPLAGVESPRFLVVSPTLLPAARRLFAGHARPEGPCVRNRWRSTVSIKWLAVHYT